MYVDYNNSYSIRKALTTLSREFDLSVSKKDAAYAKHVIDTVRQLHDKLSQTYRESEDKGETMAYFQKDLAKRMREFIAYLIHRARSEFGMPKYEQEIEQTIKHIE